MTQIGSLILRRRKELRWQKRNKRKPFFGWAA